MATSAVSSPAQEVSLWQWRQQSVHYVRSQTQHPEYPPLLLIHGFGASTDHWRKNIAELQHFFEVWAIDLLGFGRSAKPDWEYSGQLWQEQIQAFICDVIGRPTVIAGNSLGGYVALCVAAHSPQSVAGVILLNSAGPFSSDPRRQRPPSWRQAISKTIQTFMLQPVPSWLLFQYIRRRTTIRRTLEQGYVDKTAITPELIEDIRRPADDPGAATVFASVFKSPQGQTTDALLAEMNCPLLLLWGEGDPWMNCRQRSRQFHQHYTQLTEHFLLAGHCPHDESPDKVNALMREWICSVSTASSEA